MRERYRDASVWIVSGTSNANRDLKIEKKKREIKVARILDYKKNSIITFYFILFYYIKH